MVIDNEYCTIKITGIDPDNVSGFTLKAEFENKSKDTTYTFWLESAAVNGVQCTPFFAIGLAPGAKKEQEITPLTEELEKGDICDYTNIELAFCVFDCNDWTTGHVVRETLHVYPYGRENALTYVRQLQPTDYIAVDNEYVTVVVIDYEKNGTEFCAANLFVQNKSHRNIAITVEDMLAIDSFWGGGVAAGKCAFLAASWRDTAWREDGIGDVAEIKFRLRAYDNDNWLLQDLVNETVTLKPRNAWHSSDTV